MSQSVYTIYFLILSVGIAYGQYRFKLLANSSKWLWVLLVFTLFEEIAAYTIAYGQKMNFIVYHIFTPLQYALIAWTYYQEIRNKVIIWSIFIFLLFAIVNSLFLQDFSHFNSHTLNISMLMIILLCTWYLYQMLHQKSQSSFTNYPLFWISCGFLLFNVGNLIFFGAFNFLIKGNNTIVQIFRVMRVTTNYIQYLLIIAAFASKQTTLKDVK